MKPLVNTRRILHEGYEGVAAMSFDLFNGEVESDGEEPLQVGAIDGFTEMEAERSGQIGDFVCSPVAGPWAGEGWRERAGEGWREQAVDGFIRPG